MASGAAAAWGEFGRHTVQIRRPRGRIRPSPGWIYGRPRWGAGCDDVSSGGLWWRHRRAMAATGDVWPSVGGVAPWWRDAAPGASSW
jgi:hypothetical protein